MADVVLVHGAWQGAWCWERVVPGVTAAGHGVSAPTLTGAGTSAGSLSPAVDLQTHVDDVITSVEAASEPVVLVVHSYAGMLAATVTARCADRVAAVVFLDAFYPDRGDRAIDLMPAPFQQLFRQRADEVGEGWRLPASDALLDVWGLRDPSDRRWVASHLTDWSLRCFESPSTTGRDALREVPRWFVAGAHDCPARSGFAPIAREAGRDGCELVEAPSGHDVMVEAPATVVDVVLAAADGAA